MRTNIDIDDELMAEAMKAGNFKTKKEAVEEGLRIIRRRKVYADLLAARGTLVWDDSDEHWAMIRGQGQSASKVKVSEPQPLAQLKAGKRKANQRIKTLRKQP